MWWCWHWKTERAATCPAPGDLMVNCNGYKYLLAAFFNFLGDYQCNRASNWPVLIALVTPQNSLTQQRHVLDSTTPCVRVVPRTIQIPGNVFLLDVKSSSNGHLSKGIFGSSQCDVWNPVRKWKPGSLLEHKDDRKQNLQDNKKALKKSLANIFSEKESVSWQRGIFSFYSCREST